MEETKGQRRLPLLSPPDCKGPLWFYQTQRGYRGGVGGGSVLPPLAAHFLWLVDFGAQPPLCTGLIGSGARTGHSFNLLVIIIVVVGVGSVSGFPFLTKGSQNPRRDAVTLQN